MPRRYRLGIDIGGTFTDLVLLDEARGRIEIGKLLTTPEDLAKGVLAIFQRMLREKNINPAEIQSAIHGTTIATNAVVERKGARSGLLTTRGFQDVLEIGREIRYDLYDIYLTMPEPLVPRFLRREINERVDQDGNILKPLEASEVEEVVKELTQNGIKSLAIAFLHAYAYPQHERQALERIQRVFPALPVSLSSEVACEIREYERTSTTVANAYLQPLMESYLENLELGLHRDGYQGRLFIMMSNGGISSIETAKKFPVRLIESGPAAGALAGSFLGNLIKEKNLISFDMGGTTAKASVIKNGVPTLANEFEAARVHRFKKGSGLPLRIPSIELIEIGAGGGSIAYLDSMGLLKVGPQSAGAEPGPTCYGRGGTEPTVTDADLLLGFLNEEYFLGGEMKLDRSAAIKSIQKIAQPLKMEMAKVAAGIFEVVNENMATAMRIHIAEKGEDPRKFSLVAFGGAGPVHAYQVARKLRIKKVFCPLGAGTLSALGMLAAPPALDFVQAYVSSMDEIDWKKLSEIYRAMEEEGAQVLKTAGVKEKEMVYERSADMRYIGQGYEINVPIPAGLLGKDSQEKIEKNFWREYQRLYGRYVKNVSIQGVNWRVWARGPMPRLKMHLSRGRGLAGIKMSGKGKRKVFFSEENGFIDTMVYDRYLLKPGDHFKGPAVLEEKESTVVVGPRAECSVDPYGNLVIEMKGV
ncbi:MAG: hydantoinase/oxoprolinase family protein [Deltaproteobacteria bacterium]|nr:hydantoinase/oxoprolinase family protein [Deltaproteobacteria bacterium]